MWSIETGIAVVGGVFVCDGDAIGACGDKFVYFRSGNLRNCGHRRRFVSSGVSSGWASRSSRRNFVMEGSSRTSRSTKARSEMFTECRKKLIIPTSTLRRKAATTIAFHKESMKYQERSANDPWTSQRPSMPPSTNQGPQNRRLPGYEFPRRFSSPSNPCSTGSIKNSTADTSSGMPPKATDIPPCPGLFPLSLRRIPGDRARL